MKEIAFVLALALLPLIMSALMAKSIYDLFRSDNSVGDKAFFGTLFFAVMVCCLILFGIIAGIGLSLDS